MLRHYMYKLGISLYPGTKIGKGFYIGHFGTIIINGEVSIGQNCNISQGVTIGIAGREDNRGTPTIGDNVYIGPGAKIFGNITIGNNVGVGANAVVSKDVHDGSVVGGIPAKVLSTKGSLEFINNIIHQ